MDEFPDEHSHVPQQVDDDTVGLQFTDDEGRHYYLEVTSDDVGVTAVVFDRYGEEKLGAYKISWQELGNIALERE